MQFLKQRIKTKKLFKKFVFLKLFLRIGYTKILTFFKKYGTINTLLFYINDWHMMTKRLKIFAFIMLGMFCAETSSAKVCNLGDASPECDPNIVAGTSIGTCSTGYSTCANPRAGATYCLATTESGAQEVKYTNENCCSYLQTPAGGGYQACDPNQNLVGYGKSCLGAQDNVRYWEFCGCSYGFTDGSVIGMKENARLSMKSVVEQ